jgi:hypothetical protein
MKVVSITGSRKPEKNMNDIDWECGCNTNLKTPDPRAIGNLIHSSTSPDFSDCSLFKAFIIHSKTYYTLSRFELSRIFLVDKVKREREI